MPFGFGTCVCTIFGGRRLKLRWLDVPAYSTTPPRAHRFSGGGYVPDDSAHTIIVLLILSRTEPHTPKTPVEEDSYYPPTHHMYVHP